MTEYTGQVIDGQVRIDGESPPDGARVRIQVIDEDEFWLTADMESEIEDAIARLDRGEGIPAAQVLAELRRPRSDSSSA